MDTFFEQIISIKKSGGQIALIILIWLAAIILILAAFIGLGGLGALPICGLGYGAWWLTTRFNVEYEYIVVNDSMDVDKIINKSTRKRLASISISKVERIEKFNQNLIQNVKKENLLFACNESASNAFLLVAANESKTDYIVFEPNEKLQAAIKKSLPKFISNSAFK